MNTSDLPMVFFTVVAQLAVGAFLVLGVVQLYAIRKHSASAARVIAPVLYAIGPALVLGLVVSMFHMHDVANTLNVITNFGTSWLSREIVFGCAFAAVGFLFALLEWFQKGSFVLRQVVAAIAALLGIGLLVCQSMIYYVLEAVPAWHSWAVPYLFFATALLLGCVAVQAAMMVTTAVRLRNAKTADGDEPIEADAVKVDDEPQPAKGGLKARIAEINAPTSQTEWELTAQVIKGTALGGAVVAVLILIAYPIYLGGLSQGDSAAVAAAGALAGGALWFRLALTGLVALLLGFFVYKMAGQATLAKAKGLAVLVIVVFAIALVAEFIGRSLHYAVLLKSGL